MRATNIDASLLTELGEPKSCGLSSLLDQKQLLESKDQLDGTETVLIRDEAEQEDGDDSSICKNDKCFKMVGHVSSANIEDLLEVIFKKNDLRIDSKPPHVANAEKQQI